MQSHHKVVVAPPSEEAATSPSGASLKWKCEVCTYENWPASMRCAMCQTANCNKVRTENHNNRSKPLATSSSTDIFKMGATSLSRSTSPQLLVSSQQNPEESKWACTLCTFLNWPRAHRCTQCSTPRARRASPGARKNASSTSENSMICGTHNQTPTLENLRISTPPPSKWSCGVCTYENWPRTKKCVLCGAHKETTPTRDEQNW